MTVSVVVKFNINCSRNKNAPLEVKQDFLRCHETKFIHQIPSLSVGKEQRLS